MPAPQLTTYEDVRTRETLLPQELVYGLVRDAPAPAPRHQAAVLRFIVALAEHLETTGTGELFVSPIDVVLDPERHLVVQPDLLVITRDRLHIVTDRVRGAPDLVIEILSPHPRIGQLDERVGWFAEYGVRECWLFHQPERSLDILTFERGEVQTRDRCAPETPIRSTVLPDFRLSPTEILRET